MAIACLIVAAGFEPVSASAGPETLRGQVVCSDCWFEQKDRKATPYGTSSDRIGTPEGRSFYATLSKDMAEATGLPIAPYIGYSYGQFEDRGRVIGGLNVTFTDWMQSQVIFDGVKVHPILNFSFGRHQLGLMFAQGKNPGIAYSISF